MYQAVQLTDGIFWVGAIDWSVRDFHGYTTPHGTTYNAYLIKGEKTALVDTVRAPFFPEMISRIRSVQDPGEIDYLIVNHQMIIPRFLCSRAGSRRANGRLTMASRE
jgi:flavorubredoxin